MIRDPRRNPPVPLGCVILIGTPLLAFLSVATISTCVRSYVRTGAWDEAACAAAGVASLGTVVFAFFCYGLWWFPTPEDARASGFAWRSLGIAVVVGALAGLLVPIARCGSLP